MTDLVQTQVENGVMTITVNRPQARNAINYEAAHALADAFDALDARDDVIIGILTGAGNTFSAGMDLKAFARDGQRPLVDGRGFAGLCERPPQKPLIAAVEGYALAGGFEMALSCDMIVAARDANFGLPEVKRGIVAGAGGMMRLPARIPYHVAMEFVLTGAMLPAPRAAELGLVNRLVEPGQTLAAAQALAAQVAANGPLAVRLAKRIVVESRDWPQAHMFDLQRPRVAHIFLTQDAKEGATAFAEKRAPVWKGQ